MSTEVSNSRSPNTVVEYIANYMRLVSLAMQTGRDITPYAVDFYNVLIKGKTVTQDDLDILAEKSDLLSTEIQKSLPAE